jgi:hypothetical protein
LLEGEAMVKYFRDFFSYDAERGRQDYNEYPNDLHAVVGRIAMNFQTLEEAISNVIIKCARMDLEIGQIFISELSFRNKVNVFASLYYQLKDVYHFNTPPTYQEGYFKELIKAITKCEELRNQILHSNIVQSWKTEFKIFRRKTTAKASKGLTKIDEEIDVPLLFYTADYIIMISMEVDEFLFTFKKRRQPRKSEGGKQA